MNELQKRTKKILSQSRFSETIKILSIIASKNDKPNVLEIGANDASFKDYVEHQTWTTLDKYGDPDIKADIDGENVKIPLESNSIDIAICTEVIEHLVMGTNLLRELERVASPQGRIIISVPNIVSLKSRIKVLFGKLPISSASGDCPPELRGQAFEVNGNWVGGHMMDFNPWRLKKYVERVGLSLKKHWPIPIDIRITNSFTIKLPNMFFSKHLSDFILFELSPRKKPNEKTNF